MIGDRDWFKGSFRTIRENAIEVADLLESHPAKVAPTLADVPDRAWRLMVLAVRHPYDDGPLLREVGM